MKRMSTAGFVLAIAVGVATYLVMQWQEATPILAIAVGTAAALVVLFLDGGRRRSSSSR